ncbi:MAG: glycosyltransferase family A protein [Rhodothalassiaceae bacterium]
MSVTIDIIIPTIGTRAAELDRAIASILGQVGVQAVPLLVVNGNRFDADLVARLAARPDLRLIQIAQPGVSHARLVGRRHVEAPLFSFLDDDDELLPEAMQIRLDGMADPRVDAVATNGWRETRTGRQPHFQNLAQLPEDPALALLKNQWLASAGGLYRSASITEADLRDLPDYLEITKFAFHLALTKTVARIDQPTFIKYEISDDQVSISRRYREAVPQVLRDMMAMTDRADLRTLLRRRHAAALHACSRGARKDGQMGAAWRYHLQSLRAGGWRYLSYSRHLLMPLRT